ncbi:hypothetical protein [Asanoa siamensis]|uniref:Uncharacterized protein n=1 Tax=Asanoa siamensis TaxID=926357 RepID=A0ABQ4CNX4_9ACTN|nr:hypothetical protein [Asanoa siamensis]GIF73003.1 hypothetical protein Asi02nite_25210 [Asanoa siamensis]
MAQQRRPPTAAEVFRELVRRGLLAKALRDAPADERRRLRAGATEIVWPLVFLRVTRGVERTRGHHRCTLGVHRLAPDCLDRFHDDVEAVVDHLLAHANQPIDNLEGWITATLRRATVDGYRRRRGARGALQRPRVPGWLADALGREAWLVELARSVLEWVGTDATAGTSLWPVTALAQRRAAFTGDHVAGEPVVRAEIEIVLDVMRQRPAWYAKHVDGPLGHKRAPVHFAARDESGGYAEPEPLTLVDPHEQNDALMLALAAAAVDLIEARIDAGEEPHIVVTEVVRAVFGGLPAGHDLDRAPGADPAGPDQVVALISDPDRLNRVVEAVLELLNRRDRPSEA